MVVDEESRTSMVTKIMVFSGNPVGGVKEAVPTPVEGTRSLPPGVVPIVITYPKLAAVGSQRISVSTATFVAPFKGICSGEQGTTV
eukprot:CAMPEP_0181261728 /NCGR_PEP_ID=MMETSP1097-20121128/1653_1 /TAXON_ID=35684 /ORGANISM="Pseudopedinella elastica, Strain CCMP716" /LENGTH=85 /DNA_ID=CAMNT_0023360371 /DNA_START=1209 /DNA_END=1466 /DNA_ORIENTATION=-